MQSAPTANSNHSFILRYLLLLALPLILTTLGSAYLFSVMQKNTILNTMRFFNDSTGQQWDNSISSVERQLNIMVEDIDKSDGDLPPELKERYHSIWQYLLYPEGPIKTSYYFLNNNNHISFSINPVPEKQNVSERPWYRNAIERPGTNVWSAPYIDAIDRTPVVTLSHAVLNPQGELLGVMGIDLNLQVFSARIGRILESSDKVTYMLFDRDSRMIIAHSDPLENGKPLTESWLAEVKGRNGTLMADNGDLISFHALHRNPSWLVISVFPFKNSILIGEMLPTILITLVLSLSIFTLVAIIFRQRLEHTISTLVQVVRQLRITPPGQQMIIPKLAGIEELEDEIVMISDQMQAETEKALRDPLTGLYNRRHLDETLNALAKEGADYVFAIIDIDNFKKINDNYGHPVGDVVLKRTAQLGSQLLEEHAILCRFGGEELVAIFTQQPLQQARQLMEQWRLSMQHQDWREEGLQVSFSGGIAESLQHSPEQVMARADEALYQAKKEGKNRLCLS
ncbi:MAG: sensor domain-containing diguanylate cyclase [Aeromonas sp.]